MGRRVLQLHILGNSVAYVPKDDRLIWVEISFKQRQLHVLMNNEKGIITVIENCPLQLTG